jgi:hypothetical protein
MAKPMIVCGQVTQHLLQTGRTIFTAKEVREALKEVGVLSLNSFTNYAGSEGYLIAGGFLKRAPYGWELTDESKDGGRVVVQIAPKQNTAGVYAAVESALKQFGGIVEIQMEL